VRLALLLQGVGAHSVTGSELRALFRLLQESPDGTLPHTAVMALKVLRNMAPVRGSRVGVKGCG